MLGPRAMHNGHVVLANGGAKKESRPIIKYEGAEQDNLIDLY